MCCLAQEIMAWTELHAVTLAVRYLPGKNIILVDKLNHVNQVLPTEWLLFPRVSDAICQVLDCPHADLFATRASRNLPLYLSPALDLLVSAKMVGELHGPSFRV